MTNATKSVRSKILNLYEENPNLNVGGLMDSIGWEYLRTDPLELKDNGLEYANLQNGFQMVNPTEDWFPGKPFLIWLHCIKHKFAKHLFLKWRQPYIKANNNYNKAKRFHSIKCLW